MEHCNFYFNIFFQSITPICLPEKPSLDGHKYDERAAHLIGWGSKNKHAKNSQTLRRVLIQIFPQK